MTTRSLRSVNNRSTWFWALLGVAAVFLGWNIVRALVSQPAIVATNADKAVAAREVAPAADERLSSPPGQWVGGVGVIEPKEREIRLAGDVGGRIARVLVQEGQRVEAGTVLVALDDAMERAALAEAEADAKSARAESARTERGNRPEDIAAVTAEAEAASARAEMAAGVAERLRVAAEGGGATRDDLERAAHTAVSEAAAARQAQARRDAAVRGSRREDIEAARARVVAAEARVERARASLEQRAIRTPLSGEVLQLKFRASEYYQPAGQEPLAVLGDTSELRARLDVDERDVGRLKPGAHVVVRTNAYPGVDFPGRVVVIGRRMGRKNVRSDDPVERNDTKILEVVVALDAKERLIIGQRVMGYVEAG